MAKSFKIQTVTGTEALAYVPAVARLRVEIFHDFPYIYEQSVDYEEKFLGIIYANAPNCLFVLVYDGKELVGASTARPLAHPLKTDGVEQLFATQGYNPDEVFYFSDSVLRKNYRGQGLGVRFFVEREAHARSFGTFKHTCFCAVQRAENHPLRPKSYVPLDNFWRKRGYHKAENLQTQFTWKDIDQAQSSKKTMQFWLKTL
ncbi:GNAT family N-acetyltransferase [Candidatus Venteria ishoeyi]|uniref:N-acetyltransferase domain-containing protein n=1 Tax=Candidatus Venteria ishoeyi TaxID=1899563 RepID=A0A1H6FB48_9GAMM|nr:GNAT family N-acetyltransferase [Candidatus Venteria ishoeyi]SEH06863.1 Uncharacterised protein [Candidatus Venteria ishoeyi]